MGKDVLPCALLLNDIHIGKDNITDFKLNWSEAISICKKRNIHKLIIGGDLFQSRSSQSLDVLLAVKSALIQADFNNVEVIIAEGNHDKVDQESLEGYAHIFENNERKVMIIDDYEVFQIGHDVDLYVMSYFPENGSFVDKLKKITSSLDKNRYNILYCHEGINGALSTSNEKELPASIFKDFNSVLVGHYHNRTLIDGTNIEYIGASRQHNFGEDEEKGYTILYEDGTYEFIKNKVNARYKVIEVSSQSITDKLIKTIQDEKKNGYKIKTRLTSENDDINAECRSKLTEVGVDKIEFVKVDATTKKVESQNINKKFDKNGIKEEYIIFCGDKEINANVGIKYLDKINKYVETC